MGDIMQVPNIFSSLHINGFHCMCVICRLSFKFFTYREFNTEVDIRLRKWADSLNLANLCITVSCMFLL